MSLDHTSPGFNWVGEYQVSALPWVSGSIAVTESVTHIKFPRVTKYVKLRVQGDVRLGFSSNGINDSNYFTVTSGSVETFDLRVKEIYLRTADAITGSVDVLAGLTLIPEFRAGVLTGSDGTNPGSNWFGVG